MARRRNITDESRCRSGSARRRIAGMVIGLNRDIHDKPIGMRTLGSRLARLGDRRPVGLGLRGLHFGQDAVSRVIQGILTGLGFLGAGVDSAGARTSMEVHGLTTAATVWIAAAFGVAAGWAPGSSPSLGRSSRSVLLTFGKALEGI